MGTARACCWPLSTPLTTRPSRYSLRLTGVARDHRAATAFSLELERTGAEPVFLCAGRGGKFALEDAVCAGTIAAALMERSDPDTDWELNDGAMAALAMALRYPDPDELFRETAAGKQIVEVGLREDLAFCALTDRHDVVPVLNDRQIVLAAPAAASAAAAES